MSEGVDQLKLHEDKYLKSFRVKWEEYQIPICEKYKYT